MAARGHGLTNKGRGARGALTSFPSSATLFHPPTLTLEERHHGRPPSPSARPPVEPHALPRAARPRLEGDAARALSRACHRRPPQPAGRRARALLARRPPDRRPARARLHRLGASRPGGPLPHLRQARGRALRATLRAPGKRPARGATSCGRSRVHRAPRRQGQRRACGRALDHRPAGPGGHPASARMTVPFPATRQCQSFVRKIGASIVHLRFAGGK